MRIRTFAAAVLIILLVVAALFFYARPAVRFDGDRVTASDPASFYLRFNAMNTTDVQALSLREGAVLSVSWQIDSGTVDVLIAMEGEAPLYQANGRGKGDAAAFDLTIPKAGDYTVSVSGKNARGWLRFEEKQ